MLKLLPALALAAVFGFAQADAINVRVAPPKGLPGPEVKVKVGGADDVKIKGDKGKHKGEFKGKHKGH